MGYELLQLINIDTLELFMDNLYELIKTPSSIISIDGDIIVSNKERKFCENYNHICLNNRLRCIVAEESFIKLMLERDYYIFKCEEDLINIAIPIIVNGHYLASLVSGDFLLEEEDIDRYNRLAKQLKFDKDGYNKYLNGTLIKSDEKIKNVIKFLIQFKEMLSFIATRHAMQLDTQEKLTLSKKRFNLIIEGSNDVIWEWNMKSGDFFISNKWKELTGFDLPDNYNLFSELIKVTHPDDIKRLDLALQKHIEGNTNSFECEYRINTKAGIYKWIFQKGKILRNGKNKHVLMAGSITDITHKKIYEEEINYLAYYDVVTNLPNRIFFEKKINEEINRLGTNNLKIAFFFIDIDDFKKINDTYGHEIGDKFLLNIANVLQSSLDKKQVVCRFGGDEFLLAVWEFESIDELTDKAEELINISNKALKIEDKTIYPSLSVGVSLYNEKWGSVDDMLKYSDIAMYKAKKSGKNRYAIFDEELYEEFIKGRKLELDLAKAVENNEFLLYYQPQIDISSKAVYGVEGLLRWNHPELGLLTPASFIDIIEKNEMIIQIGKSVIQEACITVLNLRALGYEDLRVSVNICEKQLVDTTFLSFVQETFKKLNVDGKNICFEITERVLLNENKSMIETLDALRDMGIEIFIDDFGTKYSSLNYLNIFNVSGIKIDKSFIDKINYSKKDYIITKNIVKLAQDLKIQVIAEGVEKEEQLNCLEEMCCSKIQGFLFSRPVSNENLISYLKEFKYLD